MRTRTNVSGVVHLRCRLGNRRDRGGAESIRRARSRWSCRSPRAGRPTRSRASGRAHAGVARPAGHHRERDRRGAAASASAGSRARRPTATRSASASGARTSSTARSTRCQYDVLNDFEPVALLASSPLLIVAKKAMPAKDLKELIAWLKANPDKASRGHRRRRRRIACRRHLLPEADRHALSVRALSRRRAGDAGPGGRPDRHDVRPAGQRRCRRCAPAASRPMPSRRRTAWPRRRTSRPADEAGLPGFYISHWHALWAPKGTPKDIIAKLNAAVVEALADPAVRKRLADLGPGDLRRASSRRRRRSRAFHKAEIEKWWPIIKAAGIKAE